MPIYETLSILHPELPEARIKDTVAWMQKILEDAQGSVLQVDEWGMRDLAYRIKKQRRGYYVRLESDAPFPALKELERNLRLNEDVLRFLSIVLPAPTESQAALSAPTTSRPEPASSAPGTETPVSTDVPAEEDTAPSVEEGSPETSAEGQ